MVFIALTCSVLWNCSPYSCPFANGPSSICSGSRTASISSSPTRSPGDSLGDFPLGNGHGAMKCGVHNPFLNKILNVIPKKCHTSWKISDKLIYPLVPSGKRLWKITTISMGKSTISTGPFGASIANSKRLHRTHRSSRSSGLRPTTDGTSEMAKLVVSK